MLVERAVRICAGGPLSEGVRVCGVGMYAKSVAMFVLMDVACSLVRISIRGDVGFASTEC